MRVLPIQLRAMRDFRGFMLFMAAAASVALAMPAQVLAQDDGRTVVLQGGWLFDGVHDARVRNPGIVVRGGKILSIGAPSSTDLQGAQIVAVSDGETILPGLFDLHAHYNLNLFGTKRHDDVVVYPGAFIANGVTSTFPAGEYDPDDMQALRVRIQNGEQVGPRLYNSGPYYGTARIGWNKDWNADSIRADMDKWAARGIRGVKAKGIGPEQLKAVIDRAHWHGLTVTGHLDSGFRNSVNPKAAIIMGIDRIEHFMGGDALVPTQSAYASLVVLDTGSAAMKDIIRTYISHHAYYDATLSTYGAIEKPDDVYDYWFDERSLLTPYVLDWQKQNPRKRWSEQFHQIYIAKLKELKAFYDHGGKDLITLGTDHPSWGDWFSPFQAHREMHAMVRAGLPPAAALKAGTINAARALNVGDKLGSVEPGKFADIIVVTGNPLADIRATHNVRLVMKGGRIYDPKTLLESLKGKLGPKDDAEAKSWRGAPRAEGTPASR